MHRVTPIPCLRDNYAYLIEGDEEGVCAVVDPSEAAPIEQALAAHGLRLGAILATHHHHDHVGGVVELSRTRPGLPVLAFGPDADQISGVTRRVEDGERLQLVGLNLWILHIPGHTLGAIAYVVEEGSQPRSVFTGDTLFGAGCGRLFEGTAADMNRSLNHTLGALADPVQVYCGHEYTASNLRFAAHVEPASEAIRRRAEEAQRAVERGAPTVPSTLGEERATNPFLRVKEPAVRAFAGCDAQAGDDVVFGKLRAAKDHFKG